MNKQGRLKLLSLSLFFAFGANIGLTYSAFAQENIVSPDDLSINNTQKKEIVRKKGGELRINGIGDDNINKAEELKIDENSKPDEITPLPVPKPVKPLTNEEIAKQIAPFFDVKKDYPRLTQCYGTADFLGALTKIRASAPGASAGLKGLAAQINGMKAQMQPFVLASTRTIADTKFRKDYDLVAKKVEKSVFSKTDFNAALSPHLKTLDACNKDLVKWRGGK